MAGRSVILATGEYYHIFNRGIARQPVFFSKRDYERFTLTLSYYRFKDAPVKLSRLLQLPHQIREEIMEGLQKRQDVLVDILCYALMPNHFHLILKQNADRGITSFMSKTINSYTRFINTKQERLGDLFQGVFKAVHVETDEQLIHLSRYIHLNPLVSYVVKEKELTTYLWSSLPEYIEGKSDILTLETVLTHFKSPQNYLKFVLDQADYGKKLEEIKHMIFE